MSISVLLLTLNEQSNIRGCIEALDGCDDIVVLDSYSKDDTVALARQMGARVYARAFDNFADQRNFALAHISFQYDWVLHLDADEILTPELKAEMTSVILNPHYDAYRIPSKTMFFGRWLRYSGMYPSYQVRLARKTGFRFKQVGHGQREDIASERIGTLKHPYLHYSFSKGLSDWIEKHNRYSTDEAWAIVRSREENMLIDWAGLWAWQDRMRRRRTLKTLSFRLPCRPLLRFLYMYVLRRGFLDGRAGFTYCQLLSFCEYMIVFKTREYDMAHLQTASERDKLSER